MRLLLNVRHHINMGNYEHVEVTGSIEVDTEKDAQTLLDYEVEPGDLAAVQDFVRTELADLTRPGLIQAATYTDEEASYVLPLVADSTTQKGKK